MADDVIYSNAPSGVPKGTRIATDDVGGAHIQRVKLDIGADGVSVPVTDLATEAKQDDLIAEIQSGVQLQDELGVAYGVKHVDNKPRVSSMPYLYDIAEGNVPDHYKFRNFGERLAVAVVATGVDVWGGVANVIPRPVAAGEQLVAVSTSALDDSGNTGVNTIHIHYLDPAGDQQETTVIMDGLNPVNLTPALVRFVNKVHVESAGTGGVAAGDITIYKSGAPATVYARITAGGNKDLSTQKMVPADYTFYLTQWSASATASKPIALRLRMTQEDGVLIPGIFLTQDSCFLQDGVYRKDFDIPIKIPELTVIKISGYATQAGANVSASWGGWMEV